MTIEAHIACLLVIRFHFAQKEHSGAGGSRAWPKTLFRQNGLSAFHLEATAAAHVSGLRARVRAVIR